MAAPESPELSAPCEECSGAENIAHVAFKIADTLLADQERKQSCHPGTTSTGAESILCGPSRAGICIQRTYSADIPSIPISTVIHTADVASGRPQTAFDCNVYRIDTGNPIAIGSPSSKIA